MKTVIFIIHIQVKKMNSNVFICIYQKLEKKKFLFIIKVQCLQISTHLNQPRHVIRLYLRTRFEHNYVIV